MGWLRGLLLETGISILERPPEVTEVTLPLCGPWRHFRKSLREEEEGREEQGWRKEQKSPQGEALGKPWRGERQESPGERPRGWGRGGEHTAGGRRVPKGWKGRWGEGRT